MKKHNQDGFSAIEVIIVIVVLLAVAGIGFTVWRLQTTTKTSINGGIKSLTTKTYQNDGLTFSYSYPSNFKTEVVDGTVTSSSPDYDVDASGAPRVLKGESITIEGQTSDGVDQEGTPRHLTIDNYIVANFSDAKDQATVEKTAETTTINGIKTLQFDYMDTRETIFFVDDGKRIVVKLTYPSGSSISDHDNAYNQVVNSIKQ